MVYGFIERSGGYMRIDSEIGKGTAFYLCFPRVVSKITADYDSDHEALPRGNEKKLIVDDEQNLRDIAAFNLDELGYITLTAKDGPSALTILNHEHDINILFSDIVMPGGMDGYQLALAAHDKHPDLKILLTSGYTQKRENLRNSKNNFLAELNNRILDKPYEMTKMAFAIKSALHKQN